MKTKNALKSALALKLALSLVLSTPLSAHASSAAWTRIGVAGGVVGNVKAFPPEPHAQAIGRVISSGQPLYLGETINTGPEGSLQVMLNDETVFTIGPRSSMVLDEFVYDSKTHSGKVVATVKKGLFRFVTGLIGHNKPSDMKVKFPTAVMGIRGTMVAGEVAENGATTAVLLGPGPQNNAPKERIGAFRVENAAGAVDVLKPGYATYVAGADAAPTVPTLLAQEKLEAILQGLTPSSKAASPTSNDTQADQTSIEGDDGSQNSASAASGQATAEATGDLSDTQDIADLSMDLTNDSVAAANDIGNPDLAYFIQAYQSSWDDVRGINSGTGYYDGTDVFYLTQCGGGGCNGSSGNMSMHLDIDFGAKTVGSASSNVTVAATDATLATPVNDTVNFAQQSFAALTGAATLSGTSASGATTANISLLNYGGPAQSAVGIANYKDANGTQGYGAVYAPLTCSSAAGCH